MINMWQFLYHCLHFHKYLSIYILASPQDRTDVVFPQVFHSADLIWKKKEERPTLKLLLTITYQNVSKSACTQVLLSAHAWL